MNLKDKSYLRMSDRVAATVALILSVGIRSRIVFRRGLGRIPHPDFR